MRQAVYKFKPDILHSSSRLAYLIPLLLNRLPKIMTYHRYTGGKQITIASYIGGQSLTFTGVSQFIAKQGQPFGGVWYGIPNFVDTESLQFKPNISVDSPLVFLSRIERIKGAHHAIAIAKQSGKELIIAGNYSETGSEWDYWQNEILPEIGKNGIKYIGTVDDNQKNELLGHALALVLPIEWREPFGIVFAEALACGTPVIACPNGAVPEIVRHGIEGFHIKDVKEGCEAVFKVHSISRAACRERVETLFSRPIVVDQYEALYKEALQRVKR